MNVYEILTSYVSLSAYYVVAESIVEAKKMFFAKYPDFRISAIKKIKLIAEDVIISEVTEEWIEEKARELCEQNYVNDEAKDFIRSLIKEIQGIK